MSIDITFDFLRKEGYTGVTDFCRYLISTGDIFENVQVHVYREEMLCLIVNDVYKAATLEADGCRWRTYRKNRAVASGEARGEV